MHDSWLDHLIGKHGRSGIVVDANLLFVLCVGLWEPALVGSAKGTREYHRLDFDLLDKMLGRFNQIVTTPNIMTETSNLAQRLSHDVRVGVHRIIRDGWLKTLEEQYVSTSSAASHEIFERLGLTDAVIATIAGSQMLVLTNDLDLSIMLERREIDCIHYDRHLRPEVLSKLEKR